MNVRVLQTIKAIDAKTWDVLCDDPVFSHGWFRALEESQAAPVEPRHLILEDDRGVVGILPCFIQYDDPYYTLSDFLFGRLAPLFKRLGVRVLPALLAYSPLAHRTDLFLAPHVDRASAVRIFDDTMNRICREERLPVSGWLFVSGWDRSLLKSLRSAGHAEAFLCPTAHWVNQFDTFEDYLDDLKHLGRQRYKAVRNELNRHARSGVELDEKRLTSIDSGELAAMQSVLYSRHQSGVASPFTPKFFDALKRGLGDCAVVHTARWNGKLLSYGIALKGSDRWHMFVSGDAPDQRSHADKLHFNLNYYFPVRQAIAQRIPQLNYGLSTYQAKVGRGCTLEPLHVCLRPHTPPLRYGLPVWMRFVSWWYHREHRPVMFTSDRLAEVLQRNKKGLFPWWRRWIARVAERTTFVLTASATDRPPPLLPGAVHPSVRLLKQHELVLIRPTAHRNRWSLFLRFQQEGCRCYGAWIGSKLVGYIWITCGRAHYSTFFGHIPLKPDEAFIGYIFVWPKYRGRGIAFALKRHAVIDLAAQGVRVLYSGILITNTTSLKTFARMGARPILLWKHWRVGPVKFYKSFPIPTDHLIAQLFLDGRKRMGLSDEIQPSIADLANRWNPRGNRGHRDTLWRQALVLFRERGMNELIGRATKRLVHVFSERSTMIECVVPLPADRPFSIPEVAARPAIRRLNVNDLSLLQSITPAKTYRLFKRFIQQGFQCYAALVDGKVVGYNWYTDRPYRSPFTGILFPCHPDEMFLVYSHTLPAWRSRGVDGVLKAETLNEFQRRGIRTIRSVIDEMNRPSLRMMSRWGGVPCRRHRYRRWLWWRRATSESIQPTPELMTRLVGRIPRSHEEAAAHIAARQKSRAHADS